jgi:hypothetical protein
MSTVRKITVEVPRELLEKAQQASQAGVTQTVLAASEACQHLLQMRGNVRFSKKLAELKADR